MNETKFGPAGNDEKFYFDGFKSTLQAPEWVSKLGLDLFEYSFGSGVNISDATATAIGEEAKKWGVEMSVHAPYYINFASPNPDIVEKSYGYITSSLKKLACFGGNNCVVHLASVGKQNRDEAVLNVKKNIDILLGKVDDLGLTNLHICPETMGKSMQIGTVAEIVDFCSQGKNLYPTFDFGHINALEQGSLKTKQDFLRIFDFALTKLEREKVENCHIHFSKIEYGLKGEIRHLTLEDLQYGPEFEPLAEAIISLKLTPSIICESKGVMATDAVKLKKIYQNIKR